MFPAELSFGVKLRWPGDSQHGSGRFATRLGAIRNTARGDSRKFIRENSFAEKKPYSRNVYAIRANRLKPAIRVVLVPRNVIRKKGGSVQERSGAREVPDSRESANRFARIGPSLV